tara:strand:+ start:2665 stop:4104 length:1440 start_codon:yes stop_codon:yes gene_type:complete
MVNKQCPNGIPMEECLLAVLRSSIDKIERKQGGIVIKDPNVQSMLKTVEDFMRKKKVICYGGTAINNILPPEDQFYDKKVQLPDYDFFSTNALEDAKELADILAAKGYPDVRAKAGVHSGTYKVYAMFMAVADITQLDKTIFRNLKKAAIVKDGISYCPSDYLRMSMYLELSRPNGDVSRWEKVAKRLILLNKHYPLQNRSCESESIQRLFSGESYEDSKKLFHVLRSTLAHENVVFFGALANSMYGRLGRTGVRGREPTVPDFDVLSTTPQKTADKTAVALRNNGFKNVRVFSHNRIGEVVSEHYEIRVDDDTVAFIYKPIACHGYNVTKVGPLKLRIASIDTMMSFYLAFIYAGKSYYDKNRILCMCEALMKTQQRELLSQRGILKRFDIQCYGKQESLMDIQRYKSAMHRKLKAKGGLPYEKLFLRYEPPGQIAPPTPSPPNKTPKTTVKPKTKRKPTPKKKRTRKKKNNLFLGIF